MQPNSEFQFQLFGAAGAPQSRIMTFSCDHIIPPDHVLPLVLTRGPSNKQLDFSWCNRSYLLDELTNLLLNINQVIYYKYNFFFYACSLNLFYFLRLGCFRRSCLFSAFV